MNGVQVDGCRHVDPDGFCHVHPDPCKVANETRHRSWSDSGIQHHQEWSMAALLCFGTPLLGSREAVLDEVARADVSTFTLNETSYTFAFPHELYSRIFYPEAKILNAAQPFEQRVHNEKRLRQSCPLDRGRRTGCMWARSWGVGVPMAEAKLPRDVHGVIADVGAHVGTECVYLARRFVNAHVLCVEPLPRNVFYTRWNLMANGLDESRVTVVPKLLAKQSAMESKLLDWGLLQGGTEGAWASYRAGLSVAPGEVLTMYKDETKADWRQAIMFHVESISLEDLVALAGPFQPEGETELLFLRLNCEGCEFEVLPPLLASRAPGVRYIGGEIHGDCDSKKPKTLEQAAIGGAALDPRAVRDTYEALCTDALWPEERRDFVECENYKSSCASSAS